MKVVEIRRPEELENLRPAWAALLRESPSNTIFLTWEWLTAWWSAYGKESDLRIWAAFDESGALCGLAPFREHKVRRGSQTARVLSFVGDGSNDSDYLDFAIAPAHEGQVIEAFSCRWVEELKRGTVLQVNEIPASSPNLSWLKTLTEGSGAVWKAVETPCSTV